MPASQASASFESRLATRKIRRSQPHQARSIRIPGFGRVMLTRDPGDAGFMSREWFATHLEALHRNAAGELIGCHDLGSGKVTNVGVLAMANDFKWASPSAASCATLALSNWHAVGTGTTASAATDVALETLAAPTTSLALSGTQSLVSAANKQEYKSVCTVNFTGSAAITEWGLHTAEALSVTTGTPATATSATSLTATGTPYTASTTSVKGEQQLIVKAGTTAVWGLITSNSTSALTIPAWYKTNDGTAGATPGSTEAFTLKPVLWDHKVFAALNVENGDSIEFKYSLLINSGG